MKILVGCIYAGDKKRYALEQWITMAKAVFCDVDVLFVVDSPYRQVDFPEICVDGMNSDWCTAIVERGKEALGRYALDHGYDYVVWQGVDCFYETKQEFDDLAALAKDHDICGALVAGRNKPEYPVCRRFVERDGRLTPNQEDIEPEFFDGTPRLVKGYIGSDATFISRRALQTVTMDGYIPWEIHCRGLGPEEWFMYRAIKDHGYIPCCHTGIRPWHAHETNRTVRYPDGDIDLDSLSWASAGS